MKFKFFNINKISGIFYDSESNSDTILIYAMGAPNVPDNGTLNIAPAVVEKGIDLFVPDYIGFGRTGGSFTPQNCIRTLLQLYKSFKNGCTGINHYEFERRFFKYKRILFVGKSLGAAYIPLLPKYNTDIKELAIFCGSLDQSEQGKIYPEETNKSFIDALSRDFHYLYNNMNAKVWWKHIEDKDGLSPMDNISYLSDCKLFIAHGKKDICVNYLRSVNYYKKIIKTFSDKKDQFQIKLYKNGDHGSSTTNKAIIDFLKWICM